MAVAISEGFKTCPEALILRNIEKTQKKMQKSVDRRLGMWLSLIHISEPTRLGMIS